MMVIVITTLSPPTTGDSGRRRMGWAVVGPNSHMERIGLCALPSTPV